MAQQQRKSAPQTSRTDAGRTRAATDSGRTGDKVPTEDPAAAPLETDAESTGQPTSGEAAQAAVDDQTSMGEKLRADHPGFARSEQGRGEAGLGRADKRLRMWLIAAVVVLSLVGLLTALGLL